MCRIDQRVNPDMAAHEAYEKRYQLYRKINAALDPVWDEVQPLVK